MKEQLQRTTGRPRWPHVAGIVIVLALLGLVLRRIADYPSIAEVYRPATLRIERVERREVRQGKRTVTLDFHRGTYPAYDMRFPSSFATRPGIHAVGDTVCVLYNPEQPANNLIYAPRSGAVHLPEGSNLQGVEIDYEEIVRLFDSIDVANR